MFDKCLERQIAVLGERNPLSLTCLNNLAIVYARRGKFDDAVVMLEKCCAMRKDVLGDNHPDTLHCLHDLASVKNARPKKR